MVDLMGMRDHLLRKTQLLELGWKFLAKSKAVCCCSCGVSQKVKLVCSAGTAARIIPLSATYIYFSTQELVTPFIFT